MHDRVSVNALCFMGSPFRELTGYWRELGAHRVSLMTSTIFDEGLPAAQAALATGDYKMETLSHQFLAGHLEPREETWRDPRERLSRVIDWAKTIGARSIYMVTGGHGTLTWEEAAKCFSAAVAPCVAHAKEAGVPLLIECSPAVNAHSNIAHNLRDAVTAAEMAGIGVCADLYACWTEAGLRETIERAIPRCSLVQVGDYVYGDRSLPARAVPGDGAIPIKRLCDWLLRAGYKGTFDLELLGPRIDNEGRVAAVGRAAKNLGEILQSLGV
ncbi:MAG: sugar phosphate isomerase/epimerase [Rhodospirillaceae bacterium]|nr:MAG: sugar phosphate isomerase/epimerase [Rhodospirillaceae bacterium]